MDTPSPQITYGTVAEPVLGGNTHGLITAGRIPGDLFNAVRYELLNEALDTARVGHHDCLERSNH